MTSKVDPNRGPLQLSHDPSPKDIHTQAHTVDNLGQSPRYQGFPNGYFIEGRKPILGRPPEPPDQYHRRKQHFIKGIPVGEQAHSTNEHESSHLYGVGQDSDMSRPNARITNGKIEYGTTELPDGRVSASPKKTLFWNEDRTSAENRKKVRQVRDADWDISTFKEVKKNQLFEEQEAKKKDLQMLRDYKPWGRGGGGAPRDENQHYRTKKMELKELAKGKEILNFPAFGKPGHGAPLRTSSGNVVTSLKANTDIRFRADARDLSKEVENKTRYRTTRDKGEQFTNELAQMAQERKMKRDIEKQQELQEELKTWEYDPYGKPGAGAPLKTDSGNIKAGRRRMLVRDPYEMRELEIKIAEKDRRRRDSLQGTNNEPPTMDSNAYDPWGKGSGMPDRDADGNIKRYKWSNPNTVKEYNDPEVNWATLDTKSHGGGGQLLSNDGVPQTKFPHTLVMDQSSSGYRGANRKSEPIAQEGRLSDASAYNPWGRPGNGAPMTDNSGNIIAANRGKAHMDQMGIGPLKEYEVKAKHDYLTTLKEGMKEQHENKQKEENNAREPGGEVASWIRSKEIGYPKRDPATGALVPVHYKGTSDVTQHQMDIRRPKLLPGSHDYKNDLVRQAEERHRQIEADKQTSRDDSAKHHEKFEHFWNRPGAGAPVSTYQNRKQILNMEGTAQTGHRDQPPWIQPHIVPEAEKKWVRTKAIEQRFKPEAELKIPGKEYTVRAPWAVL